MKTIEKFCFPNPVEDAAQFFDRAEAVNQIRTELPHRTVVILGGRLIGKTSLLNVVAAWAEEQPSFAVIRLAHARSRGDLMREIMDGIHHWVVRHRSAAQRLGGPVDAHRMSIAQFTDQVVRLGAHAPGVNFVLCVDEFDSMLEGCDAREARQILDLIRHLATVPEQPIRLFFTMLRIPEELKHSYGSPFLSEARFVALKPWPQPEAMAYAEWLLGDRPSLTPAAHAALFAAAGGHPYFTKAVLNALVAQVDDVPTGEISPADVAAAVRSALNSLEVDFALSNLVGVHLPEHGAEVLDLAAKTVTGITVRSLNDIGGGSHVLKALVDAGLMTAHGDRYLLALGLWREWRLATPRGRLVHRIGQFMKRVLMRRMVTRVLVSVLIALTPVLTFGTAFLQPAGTITVPACPGNAAGLSVRASYPSYVSSGDEQELQLIVVNNGQTDSVNGSVVVGFPSGGVTVHSTNSIAYDRLRPGEQRTRVIAFTSTVPATLFRPAQSGVPVELRARVGGVLCPPQRWRMDIAPIPHLEVLQKAAAGLVGLVLIPILIELVLLRRGRRGRRRTSSAAGR